MANERYAMTFNIHDDIEGIFDEIEYCAALVERLKEIAEAKNYDMRVFVDILDVNDGMKKVVAASHRMFNDEKQIYDSKRNFRAIK